MKTAPEIIATLLCWDITEVKDGRYQSTLYSNPSVYTCGNDYYCAPTKNQNLPKDVCNKWEVAGEQFGRTVYIGKA